MKCKVKVFNLNVIKELFFNDVVRGIGTLNYYIYCKMPDDSRRFLCLTTGAFYHEYEIVCENVEYIGNLSEIKIQIHDK